jgi:hypothetical protein
LNYGRFSLSLVVLFIFYLFSDGQVECHFIRGDVLSNGRLIIATQKHLVSQRVDAPGLEHLDTTILAGKCGRLLARIRQLSIIEKDKLVAIGRGIGIMPSELDTLILPAIEEHAENLLIVQRARDGSLLGVEEFIPSKQTILESTEHIWEETGANEIEHANLAGLEFCEGLPRTQDEYLSHIADSCGSDSALKLTYDIQVGFRLLKKQEATYGLKEPIVYNEYMWGERAAAIYNAIHDLAPDLQEQLLELLNEIQIRQGIPIEELIKRGIGPLLQLAKKTGVIDVTAIKTRDGVTKEFATTPRIWGTLGQDVLEDADIFDDVKLFLNSIRYGEVYGKRNTGKILDPIRLLTVLLEKGEIGPATAIGKDYPLVEQAGIVSIETSPGGLYIMHPRKRDVIETVVDILEYGSALPLDGRYDPSPNNLNYPGSFITGEEIRSREADPPPQMQEALNNLLTQLRTS